MKLYLKFGFSYLVCVLISLNAYATNDYSVETMSTSISLKVPGNSAKEYPLKVIPMENRNGAYDLFSTESNFPAKINQVFQKNENKNRLSVTITALDDIYFNYKQQIATNYKHNDCQFYMPGFWYHRNMRSPKEAPSFHTSDSWTVREDRLSVPLTGVFNEKTGNYITISRVDDFKYDALATHQSGEIIVSGKTSIGSTGFENIGGKSNLSISYPYNETPKTYIRKLTLIPSVKAFQFLKKGETITLVWDIQESKAIDYSSFIQQVWEYSYDLYKPQAVETPYTTERMKEVMSNFFRESYVDKYKMKFLSGVHMHIDHASSTDIAEVGFVGRTLINAFNALEYGEKYGDNDLIKNSNAIFESYLKYGFFDSGFFKEVVHLERDLAEDVLSIRRQSEGIYAMLYYLQYEKKQGRKHPEWEQKVRTLLNTIIKLQKEDGSFPRKFKEDFTIIDNSGGSTPSATPMMMLAYKYFNDKKYLECAKKTAKYLEAEIISKADYFSSTLDANCEDKEASYYASTALYHLSIFSKDKKDKIYYRDLAKKTAYFALTWYYLWDVPFAQGQMIGDIGLKTRGWGNVSVENNHIDVFIFEFASILDWLADEYKEARFSEMSKVIKTSMTQLLPYDGHMCGIGKVGYYPEVVQHTNWDYGKNGKGYYNDIFAPGWTIASLWHLFTPERIELFTK